MAQQAKPTDSEILLQDLGSDSSEIQWKKGYIDVNYELPPVIKSAVDGQQATLQTAAVVSGLLAGTSAQLFGFFKDPSNYPETVKQGQKDTVVLLCYLAILLNIGATVCVFMLTSRFNMVHRGVAAFDPASHAKDRPRYIKEGEWTRKYIKPEAGLGIHYLWWNWLLTFSSGVGITIGMVLTYAGIAESPKVAWIVLIVAFFGAIPVGSQVASWIKAWRVSRKRRPDSAA